MIMKWVLTLSHAGIAALAYLVVCFPTHKEKQMSVPSKRSGESKSEYKRRLQQQGYSSDIIESAVDAASDYYSSSTSHTSYSSSYDSSSSGSDGGGGDGGGD